MQFKILIVEDNPGDVTLLTSHLDNLGFKCCYIICENGEAALQYLQEQKDGKYVNKPDLIILDLNLPKKSGHEVLEEIKSHEVLRETPVIIFSSSSAPEEIKKAYRFANSYVIKPFELSKYEQITRDIYNFWFKSAKLPTSKRNHNGFQ